MPSRNPLCRWMPTLALGSRSNVMILGVGLPMEAFTYLPRIVPACWLSLAYVAATAVLGVVSESSATTTMPLAWASLMAFRMPAELLGVIMMPLTPCWIRFSIAVTWPSLSPSNLPARAITSAPLVAARALADSRSFTKYGLESVLV